MKKIILLSVLFFQIALVFGQSVGSIVENKTIYNSSGIVVSYSITYYGVGDCNDNTNGGLKKYRIDFNARNNSNLTVKLVGSRVDLDDNLGWQHYCRSGIYILFGSYPGFEDFGTLVPNESVNATKYVYMLQNSNDLPYITSNIIPLIQKEQQTHNQNNSTTPNTQNQNNTTHTNTPSNSNTQYQSTSDLINRINELCTEFQSLLNEKGITNSTYNLYCKDNHTYTENDYSKAKSIVSQLEAAINNEKSKNVSTIKSNTQENDLTEYNRSKAEMEEKLRVKNEEIARQNEENTKKLQLFNNAIKAGVNAHNSNNYAEAKNQFNIALNNSTNEHNRNLAQDYYNKTVNAEKGQGKIKAVTDFAQTTLQALDALQKAKQEKREQDLIQREQEQKEQQALAKQREQETAKDDEEIGLKWEAAQKYANNDNSAGYANAIELMLPYAKADKINAMALNSLGFWHWKIKDYSNAKRWYEASANKDDATAMYNLGIIYENGQGTDKNIITAAEWYRKSCIKGYEPACKNADFALNSVSLENTEISHFVPVLTDRFPGKFITVQSIIDKYIIAIGGKENITKVKTLTRYDELKGNSRITITANGKMYQESQNKGRTFRYSFNGTTGYSGYDGEKKPLSQTMISSAKKPKLFPPLGLEFSELRLGNIEIINGMDCYTLIEPTKQSGNLKTKLHYFNTINGLWMGTKLTFLSDYNYSNSYILYDDFRLVDGVKLSFMTLSFSSDGKEPIERTIVKEIKINEANIEHFFQ